MTVIGGQGINNNSELCHKEDIETILVRVRNNQKRRPAPHCIGWHRRPACPGRRIAGRNLELTRVHFTFLGSPLNLTPNLNLNLIALLPSD